jgi:hypothetical protein
MEMWKTKPVSHISTPPATTTDKGLNKRYTNTPLGTKDRSRQENNCNIWLKMLDTRITAVVALPTIHVSQRKP